MHESKNHLKAQRAMGFVICYSRRTQRASRRRKEEGGLAVRTGLGSLHLGRKEWRVQTWSSQVSFGEVASPLNGLF